MTDEKEVIENTVCSVPSARTILEKMFNWWNGAYKVPGAYTADAFSKYFTPDAVMIIDGSERARGYEGLAENFNRIQSSVDSVEIVMPPIESFSTADRIFTFHRELATIEGKETVGYVMGYAEIQDNKIFRINFINMDGEAAKRLSLSTDEVSDG